MALPPSKKVRTTPASTDKLVLGSIFNRDLLIESESDDGLQSECLQDEDQGNTSSETPGSENSDDIIIQSAPPSAPLTVSKQKQGRTPKVV